MARISIHAPRAGSDTITFQTPTTTGISIHAPRAGSDEDIDRRVARVEDFNPRSPCGERPNMIYFKTTMPKFQSTLPVRGATTTDKYIERVKKISIHAPRAGSDC